MPDTTTPTAGDSMRAEPSIEDIRTDFLHQLLATDAGRAHLLSISVEAEEGDEGDIFGQLERAVDDPELARIVARHRDDEARHALLFRGCLARLGLELQPVPDDLRLIRHLADSTGGFDQAVVETAEDIVATYALLYAIEERGVEQFPRIAEAFRPHDPDTADTYLRVARDERGHLRYCERIGRHFAPDEQAWSTALDEARAREAAAFIEVGLANIAHCTERGWVRIDALT
jgi:rubrerythrin